MIEQERRQQDWWSAGDIARASGVGSTDIAGIVGMSPNRDRWDVYASKTGLLDGIAQETNPRMKWGKLLQRVIAQAFTEETGLQHEWVDRPIRNAVRAWQFSSPDALLVVLPHVLEVKTAGIDQSRFWGESGSQDIPEHYAIQANWHMSALDKAACDVAVLIAGNDLRRYRLHRDAETDAILLDEGFKFWSQHVLARVPPPIGCSQSARDYLRQRFPRNVQSLRSARVDELGLLARLKQAKEEFDECETEKESLENAVKEAIADADGLTLPGKGKVTWLKDRDSFGADYQTIARELALQRGLLVEIARNNSSWELPSEWKTFEQMVADHQIVTRHGPRKLRCTWPKNDTVWIPQQLPVGEPALESK